MEPRRMVRLLGLPEAQRLPVVAEGLELLAEHVRGKQDDAAALHEVGRHGSGRLLATLADEEAAKASMLLDAVRVAWKPHDQVEKLLRQSFYDHLSRLNIAEIYDFPAHLDQVEIQELLDLNRDTFYVDGPNDVDWVFRNRQLSRREGLMYVDYCMRTDGTAEWISPQDHVDTELAGFLHSRVSRGALLLLTLQRIGLLTMAGLQVIQRVWRMAPAPLTWQAVRELNAAVLDEVRADSGIPGSEAIDDAACRLVLDTWHMPLLGFDLAENRVSMHATELRRQEESRRRFGVL